MRQEECSRENSLLRHLKKQDVKDKLLLRNTPCSVASKGIILTVAAGERD